MIITAIIFAGSFGYGLVLLRTSIPGILIFRLGLGLWIVAHLVYVSGLIGLLHVPFIWGVVLFGVFLLLANFAKSVRQPQDFARDMEKAYANSLLNKAVWIFLAGFSAPALIGALTPPVQRDSLVYHLALPKIYLENNSWVEIPHNIFSYFPGFIESLYTVALGLGSQFPAVIHFALGLACLGATHELGRILGLKRGIITFCLIALLTTPTFWAEMTWAYVDLANSFFWILTVLAFLHWTEEKKTLWLILLGFSMGAAYSCKYTSLILFLIVPLGVLFELWHDRTIKASQVLRTVCTPILIGLLVTSPWWLRNVILTGNPFFPFFWDFFPTFSNEWDGERTNLYNIMLAQYGGTDKQFFDYIAAPFKVFVQARVDAPDFYDGKLGWYYLLAFPVLLFWKYLPRKFLYLLGLVVIYLGYWSMTSQQARFLLVLLPILSLFVGYSLQLIWGILSQREKNGKNIIVSKGAGALMTGAIFLAVFVNTWDTLQIFNKEGYGDFFSGKVPKAQYLQNKLTYYKIYEYINSTLPENAYIFNVMTGNQGYYLERDFFSDSLFEGHTFKNIIARSASAQEIKEIFLQRKFTHILIQPKFISSLQEISGNKNDEGKMNDLFDNFLILRKVDKSYWLFEIPQI